MVFALFLGLFSLDVFNEGYTLWEAILALLIHLVPVYIVLIVLVIAWRWEWVGAVLFFALALFYLIMSWGKFHWSAFLMISGISVLVGMLFLLNWKYKAQVKDE